MSNGVLTLGQAVDTIGCGSQNEALRVTLETKDAVDSVGVSGAVDAVSEPVAALAEYARNPEPVDAEPGLVIGEQIGSGSMGVVHQVNKKDDDEVRPTDEVVKFAGEARMVGGKRVTDPEAVFWAEARAMAKIAGEILPRGPEFHRNALVVAPNPVRRFKDPRSVLEKVGLVSPYCDGGDLKNALSDEKLDETRKSGLKLTNFFLQMAWGAKLIHDLGWVYLDFKPANILLRNQDGILVPGIGDFGSMTPLVVAQKQPRFVGSTAYMAPERIPKSKENPDITSDPANDIYSLGVILFEMLTGERAFYNKGESAKVVAKKQLRRLKGWNPEGWEDFDDLAAKMKNMRRDFANIQRSDVGIEEAIGVLNDFFLVRLKILAQRMMSAHWQARPNADQVCEFLARPSDYLSRDKQQDLLAAYQEKY